MAATITKEQAQRLHALQAQRQTAVDYRDRAATKLAECWQYGKDPESARRAVGRRNEALDVITDTWRAEWIALGRPLDY